MKKYILYFQNIIRNSLWNPDFILHDFISDEKENVKKYS